MIKYTIVFFSIFLSSLISSQIDITGDWEGLLHVPNQQLKIVFHISKKNQTYEGLMDSPDQGAYGLKLTKIVNSDSLIVFDLSLFGIQFKSTKPKIDSLNGEFIQGNFKQSLILFKRNTPAPSAPIRPQTPKEPYPYEVLDVEFMSSSGNMISGTLTLPKKRNKVPGVILVSGSGPQNRDEELLNHKPFLVLADYLTRKGIAVLRYDDRGVGKSTGKFDNATTSDFAFDAQSAFDFLKKQKKIDSKRIGIIGHSEGGMIAPMVACADSNVSFVVLLAGPGIPIRELMLKQTEMVSKLNGISDEEINVSLELNKRFYTILNNETNDSIAARKIKQIVTEHAASMPNDIRNEIENDVPKLLESMLSPWFRYFINFDPGFYLKQLNCPVLAINGIKDSQVSAIENLTGIRKSVKETNNKNVYTYLMPDLNHLFQHCETGSVNEYVKIEETFSEEVMRIIADWIKYHEILK